MKIYFYLISFYVLFNNSNAIIEHISQNSKFFGDHRTSFEFWALTQIVAFVRWKSISVVFYVIEKINKELSKSNPAHLLLGI